MTCLIAHARFTYIVALMSMSGSNGLSGRVCTRQKAETYQTTLDRAFICPERYTTACGQLDWRRCTKYRVNTCYTPTARYAIRYVTVDECCPGWTDAGTGRCDAPVCEGLCQNGGKCSTRHSVPACECPDGYSGDYCQDMSMLLSLGRTVVLTACIVILVSMAILLLCVVWKANHRPTRMESFRLRELDQEHRQTLLQSDKQSEIPEQSASGPTNKITPTAPVPD